MGKEGSVQALGLCSIKNNENTSEIIKSSGKKIEKKEKELCHTSTKQFSFYSRHIIIEHVQCGRQKERKTCRQAFPIKIQTIEHCVYFICSVGFVMLTRPTETKCQGNTVFTHTNCVVIFSFLLMK